MIPITLSNGSTAYGEQAYWTGLTPGSTVWVCMDYHFYAPGATLPATSTNSVCFYNNYAPGSNNYIGGAPTTCGGTVSGTTQSSIQGESLCAGYKPPNCGGGPAPSFENVSIFKMISDLLGNDMTITISGVSCTGSTLGVQALVYSAGITSGCTGVTPICGTGLCTLGTCEAGSTISGLANKVFTITAPTPNTVYYIVIDGFAGAYCDFNISSSNCVTILPINILSFDVLKLNNSVSLSWKTGAEMNNDYFSIERSIDGQEFEEIGRVKGAGNSTTTNTYGFLDTKPKNGLSYYRFKQVDFDGKSSYSKTVPVDFESAESFFDFVPNPTSDNGNLYFYAKQDETVSINIYDMKGSIASSFNIGAFEGPNSIPVMTNTLSKGIYFIKLIDNNKVLTKKFIKE
jgi:hypothetical protein